MCGFQFTLLDVFDATASAWSDTSEALVQQGLLGMMRALARAMCECVVLSVQSSCSLPLSAGCPPDCGAAQVPTVRSGAAVCLALRLCPVLPCYLTGIFAALSTAPLLRLHSPPQLPCMFCMAVCALH